MDFVSNIRSPMQPDRIDQTQKRIASSQLLFYGPAISWLSLAIIILFFNRVIFTVTKIITIRG